MINVLKDDGQQTQTVISITLNAFATELDCGSRHAGYQRGERKIKPKKVAKMKTTAQEGDR